MLHISNEEIFYKEYKIIRHIKNQITIRIHTFEESFGRFFPHYNFNLYIFDNI